MIISFSGRKKSGKTEISKLFVDAGCKKLSFADGLKKMCCELLQVDEETLGRDKEKQWLSPWGFSDRELTIISEQVGISFEDLRPYYNNRFLSIRELLQFLGTEIIRNYNENWHVEQLAKQIQPNNNYVIDDCRFVNEKKFLEEKLDAECWFVMRPNNPDISQHASEISLLHSDFDQDNIFVNDMSLDEMQNQWKDYIKYSIKPRGKVYSRQETMFAAAMFQETAVQMHVILTHCKVQFSDKYNAWIFNLPGTDADVFVSCYLDLFCQKRDDLFVCDNPFIIENLKQWNIFQSSK